MHTLLKSKPISPSQKNDDFRDHLSAGDIVTIRYPLYKHFAIVSDRNSLYQGTAYPDLISLSNRTGTVSEEPWQKVVGSMCVEKSLLSGAESLYAMLINFLLKVCRLKKPFMEPH